MTEDELLEMLLAFVPENWGGWLAFAVTVAALLAIVLPAPKEDAHPAVRVCHRLVCILGLGSSRLRAAGKLGALLKKGKK